MAQRFAGKRGARREAGALCGKGAVPLARAALCYALSLVVGVAFILSPLIAGALAAPGTAAAEGEMTESSSASASADENQAAGYTLHGLSKITVAAYPLQDGTDDWQVRKSGGGSAATKSITERGGMLRLAVSAVWDDGVTTHEYDTSDEDGWSSRPGFTEGFTYESSDADTLSVNSIGVVTALKDGEATVKVTPKNGDYAQKTASITIKALNQEGGLRVEKIAIVDEDDKAYGDEAVKFTKLYDTKELYAKVTYTNEDVKSENKKITDQLKADLLALKEKYDDLSEERGKAAYDEALEKAGNADDAEKQAKEARVEAEKEVDEEYAAKRKELQDAAAEQKSDLEKSGLREKVVYSNAPKAADDEKPTDYEKEHYYASVADAFANIVWQVGDTEYVTLTTHSGVATLKAIANSLTRVYVTITGGDTSKDLGFGPGVAYSSVAVNVADSERARADGQVPSDDLNIKVVYEQTPDQVVKQVHYTLDEFKELGAIKRSYTLTRSAGHYVTERAEGVPVATILVKLGIDTDDISYFTLAANDGANPGKLSAKFLLKTTRYYLPNYDIGGSWQEKEQVPTMIAYEDSWNSDTTVTGEMNSGTRFRLVFGAATNADQATDKSIKFINTITIVMKGAAPSTDGDDQSQQQDKEEQHNTDSGDNGTGKGDSGTGSSGGSQANGPGGTAGGGRAAGSDTAESATSAQTASGKVGPAAVTNAKPASDANENAGAKKSESVGKKADTDQSAPWRVFEMMNKSMSDLAQRYDDNPFLPYLFPSVGILLVLAATARFLRFRRQLA